MSMLIFIILFYRLIYRQQSKIIILRRTKYEKVNRKELLRNKRASKTNGETLSTAILDNFPGSSNHAKARNPIGKIATDVDFLETDYHL